MRRHDPNARARSTLALKEATRFLASYSKAAIGRLIGVSGKHIAQCAAGNATLDNEQGLRILEAIAEAGRTGAALPKKRGYPTPPDIPFRIESSRIEIDAADAEMWAEKRE